LEPGRSVYIPPLGKTVLLTCESTRQEDANVCSKSFSYDKVRTGLCIRSWRPGDRIRLKGVGTRKLQDYFTDTKTPRSRRALVALLADGGEILWIMDERNRTHDRYAPLPGEAAYRVSVME
jgi:tRNA(Ile)-lysidine synthase